MPTSSSAACTMLHVACERNCLGAKVARCCTMGVAYTPEWVGLIAMETDCPHTWALFGKSAVRGFVARFVAMEDSLDFDSGGSVTGGTVTGGTEDEDQGNNI